jgi:thiol-disulfide isomerase/thioredoxin
MSRAFRPLAVMLVAALGCQAGDGPPGRAETPAAAAGKSLTPDKVNLVVGDAKALGELIARHRGKAVFVDLWATWCGPCVAGFPHTVELAHKYQGQGLATIAVNFDQLDDQPKVREFLAEQGADFENLMSKHDGVNQDAAADFDVEALPQYRLYDRQGKLRKRWEGQPEQLEQEIQALLAEAP